MTEEPTRPGSLPPGFPLSGLGYDGYWGRVVTRVVDVDRYALTARDWSGSGSVFTILVPGALGVRTLTAAA